MPTVDDIVLALAPELESIDSGRRDIIITLAETRTGTVYGAARPQAVAMLAAHLLTVGERGGTGGGAVTSESVGPLSISYATIDGSNDLASTSYGRMLLELQTSYVFAPMTRVVT